MILAEAMAGGGLHPWLQFGAPKIRTVSISAGACAARGSKPLRCALTHPPLQLTARGERS